MVNPAVPAHDHICTTCHSIGAPVGGGGVFIGAFGIGLAVLVAFSTHDGNVAVATTPIAIGGLAAVLRSRTHCPRCGSEAVVPVSTPRGQALLHEGLRNTQTAP